MEYSIGVLLWYGVLLGHFWSTFGAVLEYMYFCEALLGHFWSTFGALLEYFWSNFGVLLEYFWALLEYFTSSWHDLVNNA